MSLISEICEQYFSKRLIFRLPPLKIRDLRLDLKPRLNIKRFNPEPSAGATGQAGRQISADIELERFENCS